MALHVIDEAKRCLNCKKPMCREGCPINTPIPEMIQMLLNRKMNEAGEKVFLNNPLSIICSLVCDHEKQCEGHCILGKKGVPVHISSIENYISDSYFDKSSITCQEKNGKKVAVIGSGPAGITIAILLTIKGYEVTIFDAKEKIGGVLQYGIPEFRLPKTILDRYKKKLMEMGIKIRPNTTIGGALEIDDLFRDGYKAVFVGTGVWRPRTLGVKGESFGNVHFAIDYLANPDAYELGEKVAVIGAGNAAMDVARTILRKGAVSVTLFERNQTAAASQRELSYAILDGANVEYCKETVEITEEGPVFQTLTFDEEGNVTGISEDKKLVKADSTIISISQRPKNKIVLTTDGLETTKEGLLKTNEKGATTRSGIFASGDVVAGAKTVVEAVAFSKIVADEMDAYIQGLGE
ncbi:NAD(P)-dependent oxidoreductase [Anaeromicropila populeti]|uniref:Glutamate synthase (NADPH/NADH) small chain n=1 Tax=Anaeromicropila populeti TaxID=37658 RepID=A0A1I6J7Y0_9FIRM|nr:NAD(P)-dependent oxidoreductase [Anaeromicropila populeti]SFR75047.1 glutamate synthase (NADPH/NADH) small chain [Anaeromicropila populeti]